MPDEHWQFWIDVGGTFTDCFALRPDGMLLRHKLLSSSITMGSVTEDSTEDKIIDPARSCDPENFWAGYKLFLIDSNGRKASESIVKKFEANSGHLHLETPLDVRPSAGYSYELSSEEEAPIVAIRYLLEIGLKEEIPPVDIRLGTTRGTNALLTRQGAKSALLTTEGFGDILQIGYQNRPRLFDLTIKKPQPLTSAIVEIEERLSATGEVLVALNSRQAEQKLSELKKQGIESLAICLLHSSAHPQHELELYEIAKKFEFQEISLSYQVAPLIKIVARGDTTVVNAYLNPVLRNYFDQLRHRLGSKEKSSLRVLTSAGGLTAADQFVGKDSILSGPAGGVVGFSRVAQAAGFKQAIGFDMGGTSTDVSRFDGEYELEYETEKAGVRVVAPMMAVETVAAGGGSICRFDGIKLTVGPQSAGADPGPACYGRGGPLTVTDVNYFLGKIPPENFPFPLDASAVERRLLEVRKLIVQETGKDYTLYELADGFLRVANANMVKAIRSISIAKGCDPSEYVLVSFGGAAAQHACAVAGELGIKKILNHPDSGILSAYGIGMADIRRHRVSGVYRKYDARSVEDLEPLFNRLMQEATEEILTEGIRIEQITAARSLDLRYQGLDAFLTIPCPADSNYAEQYEIEHERLYGYVHAEKGLEIVAARVEVIGCSESKLPASESMPKSSPKPIGKRTAYFDAEEHQVCIFDRKLLRGGDRIVGPAIITEKISTTVVDPNWQAEVLSDGQLLLSDEDEQVRRLNPGVISTEVDPVMLEIFNNQFAGIAEQMGITLQKTASSVNVKERLDFSCALFTPSGELVVNAPHIPVHLGAMSRSVQCIIEDNPQISPGDVFITNDPYRGGSHLPDVTVVTPVHDPQDGSLLFFTASRAHHAEIGGISPGSMPPFSKNLAEEGVLISNFKLVDSNRSRLEELRELLLKPPFPTRSVDDNLADVTAQVAANQQGARDLKALITRYSRPVVEAYMKHIQTAAEQKMRKALFQIPDGEYSFTDHLDDGSPVSVSITISGDSASIDFTGTGPELPGNLNANQAIVTAAVMYVLRCLIDEDIPLNQGVLSPVTIEIPESLLNPERRDQPEDCAAMVGGNVETSQRTVDVLLGALSFAAASQGTMNNVLFGDETFGYYETICGGSGATSQSDGADAVHCHMTNTRLTDPEVLEQRYPIQVCEFSIRKGSGGIGKKRGGDGVVRRLRFLKPLDVSILSQRRGKYQPYGIAGGKPGDRGRNLLARADGTLEEIPGQTQFKADVDDILTIETPGGGGYGEA